MNISAIQQRITVLRRQIREVRVHIKLTQQKSPGYADKVRYDQLEELSNELHKQKMALTQFDVIEDWCEMNPSDFECRIYDT